MSSLICSCGKEKTSTRKKICEDCRKEKKREKNRLDAQKHRAKHGSVVKRGPLCSRCKGPKEHQERGYCLSCEREKWQERNKPDCATCGKIKENPRDSYCHACKKAKANAKSLAEGRRFKNEDGRKLECSKCGLPKEDNYLNNSYCRRCRIAWRKDHKSDEQKFKEAVRRLTIQKVRQGKLLRQPCEVCDTEIDVQAHHDDYYRPLDVRWLCRKHHQEHHKLNPE